MEKIFYLTLFWVVCQLNVTTSGAKKGKLTFIAVGDFGGSSVPPYTTYTQKRLAKVMSYRVRTNTSLDLLSKFIPLLQAVLATGFVHNEAV